MDKYITRTRCALVVDNELKELERELRELNFYVIEFEIGSELSDENIPLLFHRILVTRSEKNFDQDAIEREFGIMYVQKNSQDDVRAIAKKISALVTKHELWRKRYAWKMHVDAGEFEDLMG